MIKTCIDWDKVKKEQKKKRSEGYLCDHDWEIVKVEESRAGAKMDVICKKCGKKDVQFDIS